MSKELKKQIAIRLPHGMVKQLKSEARKHNRSIDDVSKLIVGDFFSAWTAQERTKIYRRLPEKYAALRTRRTPQ